VSLGGKGLPNPQREASALTRRALGILGAIRELVVIRLSVSKFLLDGGRLMGY